MKRNDDYYYSDNYGSSGGRRGRSLAGIVFDFLAAVATAAFALALIVAYLTPYFNPSTLGSLTIVGMFAPVLYLAVIAALLYWTIRRRWIVAAALLVVLIAGAFDVSKFYRIEFKRRYQTEAGNRDLKMLTYNVHGFHNAHNKADAAPSPQCSRSFRQCPTYSASRSSTAPPTTSTQFKALTEATRGERGYIYMPYRGLCPQLRSKVSAAGRPLDQGLRVRARPRGYKPSTFRPRNGYSF